MRYKFVTVSFCVFVSAKRGDRPNLAGNAPLAMERSRPNFCPKSEPIGLHRTTCGHVAPMPLAYRPTCRCFPTGLRR